MNGSLDLVFIGLTLSSSWGNGHATTYRALLRGLNQFGHRCLFLERDKPWYATNRDLSHPDFCGLAFYDDPDDLFARFAGVLRHADAVIVGSYVPDGVEIIDRLLAQRTDVAFYDIDTPVTLARLQRGGADYLAPRQIPRLSAYFSFTGGPTLARLKSEFGARCAMPLYCSVDAGCYRPTGAVKQWDLGYLGTYSADRQPTLERLLTETARRLPHMRFAVAGPQYPDNIDWPDNVERIEHLAPEEHPEFYSRQRFTLNITRADMVHAGWSPSVRLFEAAACGTAIISDVWPGLTELFRQDEAILLASDTEDVIRYLTGLPPRRRTAIAELARVEVLRRHTGLSRAAELIAALEMPAYAEACAAKAAPSRARSALAKNTDPRISQDRWA